MRKKNKKSSASSMITNPSRKSRTKTRKPKYHSLRLQISPDKTPSDSASAAAAGDGDGRHQLNLFPLHPENLMDEKDAHDENMAYLFSAGDGGGATNLTALLGPGGRSSSAESLTYAYGGQDNSEEVEQKMVRAAMRNKAREPSEEKWVSCCSVGSGSGIRVKEEEVVEVEEKVRRKRLLLKLDYEVVMNAWSDKGPLFNVDSSSQVVPDLNDDDFFNQPVSTNDWVGNGGLWKVPEMSESKSNGGTCIKVEGVQVGGEEYKIGRREASVLRYKEKRQNRLFAKKIRYEVRKLNAEKRPRVKGRFVKKA